ncbi:hypothetical protein O6H91_17G007600 [Diphasiastrum complanatum]|uniref:Uncharacterized protein n=1 Tax=Diphasiastrum complanatum TaxID=34168 RepID=A0ACC2B4Z2_DIPCM|nr:hypothetical protein O6H91_17G007600 [Diphasiastrum complanatum]
MDFRVATSKRLSGDGGPLGGSIVADTGSRLSLYETAPNVEVSLEEFEQFALDRLRVLKGIEEVRARRKRLEELDTVVIDLWRKHMRTPNAADLNKKDVVSHFVLRLAYCRTEELRRWFLAMESALFRHRFRCESSDSQRKLMDDYKLPFKAISVAEFEVLKDKLGQVCRSLNQPLPTADSAYYKVPFEEVPDLVANRKILLGGGHAFVPREQQLALLVVGQFRTRLSKALVLTNRKWTSVCAEDEKDRLAPIVESLSTRYLGADYTQPDSKRDISSKDLDNLAKTSFPLCMHHLFKKLREDHHLRHGGRQQLGLFLKGIGLKLEDALAFWKNEFSHKIGPDKFDKEYAYNVRHNYGKEGKKTDYTPYSCVRIIMSTPGVGDHHGCPYRHFSEENLRATLGTLRLSTPAVAEVLEKVRSHHYQLACATAFEAIHGSPSEGINHPNQYFDQSQKLLQSVKSSEVSAAN